MVVIVFGSSIEVKEVQHSKAPHPILVTELGISMDGSEEQPENAISPILVKVFGICIEVKDEQPQNALLPIILTLSPSVTVLMVVLRNQCSTVGVLISKWDKLVQPVNAEVSIVLIDFPTISVSIPVQPLKASVPIVSTPSPIFTVFSSVQPENVIGSIVVTVLGIEIEVIIEKLKASLICVTLYPFA